MTHHIAHDIDKFQCANVTLNATKHALTTNTLMTRFVLKINENCTFNLGKNDGALWLSVASHVTNRNAVLHFALFVL